jgi:hypothetical protein
MKRLTIDTKNNCYVIDSNGMNNLQENVASSLTLEKGTFDIQIVSGSYGYANSKGDGEPFVLLWIYGVDGATFINKNTGVETGATWTTLNGYKDQLKLEIKQKAVVCALFFDTNNNNNKGAVTLSVTDSNKSSPSRTLTVDSQKNCYVLDEGYLSSLRQLDSNYQELEPGNYQVKILESNGTYWSGSEQQKFKLEPWALILVKGGKFISKLTGIEVERSWCSLNGLKDEVVIEVKEKTSLTGLFFDSYKEDNEGGITLEINSLSQSEINQKYQELEPKPKEPAPKEPAAKEPPPKEPAPKEPPPKEPTTIDKQPEDTGEIPKEMQVRFVISLWLFLLFLILFYYLFKSTGWF